MLQEYAIYAARFNIGADVAYVLPALFERSAEAINMPVRTLLNEATYHNMKLGHYMAEAAIRVAEADKKSA